MARVMEIVTPLGPDALLFHGMHGGEELGRLGEYQLDLLSLRGDIDLDQILGKNVTVKVALATDGTRYFNGYITRFAQGGTHGRYHRYVATMRPWSWFLTRTADCRIFQAMTVPEVVKAVFADHETADVELELTNAYRQWTYCVQYRETDFDFVSRLLEHEGIYSYVKHADGRNTLVLTDSYSGHAPFPGCAELPFIAPERLVRPEREHISSWDFSREIQPGVYVHDDYDFERPSVDLRTQKALPRGYSPSTYEVYDYPGHYMRKSDGEQYASVRIDELGAQFETARAATNARGLSVGYLLTVNGYPRADQNREHLVVAATYDLAFSEYEGIPGPAGASYQCRFVAMSSQQPFRPQRRTPKPCVQGPQTAIVVGPSGDEIYTDQYGRVKVQFHWDRRGKQDENSSCWIRVSHPWGGKRWGAVATPRIGQEVIVDFLEGDPDQPIITGRVYNGENLPPFGFPAGAVLSGVKSNTHKGRGYNELSMDDTSGREKVTIHGQFDMNTTVEHDQTTTVHNNRTDRIDIDDAETVGKNQKCDVGVDQAITVGSNRSIAIGGSETALVALQRTHTVGVNETITVGAAQEVTIGAMQAIVVGDEQVTRVGANRMIHVGKDESHDVTGARTSTIGKDDSLQVGKNLVINAGETVTIQTGDASITLKKDGTIVIKGKDISVQGSGKVGVKASSDVVVKGSKVGIN